jgi:hypothetical protein
MSSVVITPNADPAAPRTKPRFGRASFVVVTVAKPSAALVMDSTVVAKNKPMALCRCPVL